LVVKLNALSKDKEVAVIYHPLIKYFLTLIKDFFIVETKEEILALQKTAKISKRNIIETQRRYNKTVSQDQKVDIFNVEANKQKYNHYLAKRKEIIKKHLLVGENSIAKDSQNYF
jgi:uncharacterized protein with gpF-like domain